MFCIGKGHHSNRHISRMHRGAIGVSATTLHLNSIRISIKVMISSTKSIWKGQHSNGHIWGMHRGAIGVSATTVDLLRLPYSALLPRLWAFFGIGVRCACLLRCYRCWLVFVPVFVFFCYFPDKQSYYLTCARSLGRSAFVCLEAVSVGLSCLCVLTNKSYHCVSGGHLTVACIYLAHLWFKFQN